MHDKSVRVHGRLVLSTYSQSLSVKDLLVRAKAAGIEHGVTVRVKGCVAWVVFVENGRCGRVCMLCSESKKRGGCIVRQGVTCL